MRDALIRFAMNGDGVTERPALRVSCIADASTLPKPPCGSITKEGFKRRYKKMHAEHADRDRMNDLSGHVIGCAFTVLNTLATGSWRRSMSALAHELRGTGLVVVQQCLQLCLLLNFGKPRLEIKRMVHGL